MACTEIVCGTGGWTGPKPGDPDNNSVLSADSAFGGISVSWLFPTINPHAVAHTLVFRSFTTDGSVAEFETATQYIVVNGNYFFDQLDDPSIRYTYWIRFVSVNGTYGELIGPASAYPRSSIQETIAALVGKIDSSKLTQELKTEIERIHLLDNKILEEIQDRIAANLGLESVMEATQGSLDEAFLLLQQESTLRAEAVAALVSALQTEVTERIYAVSAEIQARNEAINQEATDRSEAIVAEQQARAAAIQAEAESRGLAISQEAYQRAQLADENATAVLQSALTIHQELTNRAEDIALARFELNENLQAGLSAEASARLTLAAAVSDNAASILSEQTARADANSAMAQDISNLVATSNANAAAITNEATVRANADSALATQINALVVSVGNNAAGIVTEQTARADADTALASQITALTAAVDDNLAAIVAEQNARADGDTAEATQRNLLATQMRGGYAGNDLAQITSGLLYQERIARATQDSALAQQITLLSAGAGEQFDWKTIWYFDEGVEGWTGNGTPTVANGWLRPANQASSAHVISPTGVASDGNQYGQARLRIRKIGNPVFAGYIWWKAIGDSTWETSRRFALDAPTYDANGIGLITVSPAWAIEINQIRIDLSSVQSATDYFEIDWVAIGRPSPGASSAQLLEEQTTRASADAAEVSAREVLSAKLTGTTDPGSLTLGTLSSGLIYDERQARASQDSALSTQITGLSSTVTNNHTTAMGAISTESTTRATADSALANQITALSATVNSNTAAITTEQGARASADATEVSAREILATKMVGTTDPGSLTLATLASGLLFEERQARSTQDTAIASSVSSLQATVTSNYDTLNSAITSEQNVRANADLAEASARESLSTKMTGLTDPTSADLGTLTSGLIFDERQARSTADSAMASELSILASTVTTNHTTALGAITTESNTRAAEDAANASQITNLMSTTRALDKDTDDNAWSILKNVLTTEKIHSLTRETLATIQHELNTKVTEGLLAEATARTVLATLVSANAAALSSESMTRATADSAMATQIDTLVAVSQDTAALISAETTVRTNADNALAQQINELGTAVDDAYATLTTNYYTKSQTDSAISSASETLTAAYEAADEEALAQANQYTSTFAYAKDATYTRAEVNESTAAAQQTLIADYRSNGVKVYREDTAPTQSTYTLPLANGTLSAPLPRLKEGDVWYKTSDGNKPHTWNGAAWVYSPDTSAAVTQAYISNLDSALATADSANINSVRLAVARMDIPEASLDARLAEDYESIVGPTGALAAKASYMLARVDDSSSKVFRQATPPTRRSIDPETLENVPLRGGDVWFDTDDGNKMYVYSGTEWEVSTDTAILQSIADTNAYITEVDTTRIGYCVLNNKATDHTTKAVCEAAGGTWNVGIPMASAVKQVGVTTDSSALITVEQAVRTVEHLGALYSVKLNNNGLVGGYGIYNTGEDVQAAFDVDSFWVGRSEEGKIKPFIVDGDTVFISNAVIPTIQSDNYSPGVAGWKIHKSGYAEFENIRARGDIQATSLNAAIGTFTGELRAASGTFSGQLLAGVLDLALAAGESRIYDQPGTYSFTVPEGMTAIRISCIGAGGGGGGGGAMGSQGASGGAGGGGGDAGSVVAGTYLGVTPGLVLSIIVGEGGAGAAASSPVNGTNGGSGTVGGMSYVAGYLQAAGGSPGLGGMGGRMAELSLGGAGGSLGGQTGQNGGHTFHGQVPGLGGTGGGSGYGVPGAPGLLPGSTGNFGLRGSGGAGGTGGTRDIGYGGAGGKGGDGVVIIEAYNPNSVVLQTTFKDFTTNHFNPLCVAVGRSDLVFIGEA